MNLSAYVLATLMFLPPAYTDQSEVGRDERMKTIASAVTSAVSRASCVGPYEEADCKKLWTGAPEDLAALVVTKGWWESRYARNVHEGNCRSYECDPWSRNGVVSHRARTPWQFQKTSYSAPFWESMVGTGFEETRNAAWVASVILSRGHEACRSFQGALVWYGRGRCESKSKNLLNRYHTFQTLRRMQAVSPAS